MNAELERQLAERYPGLFAAHGARPDTSLLSFGFECEDGWYDLLDTLSVKLSALKLSGTDDDGGQIRVLQVKEKYGTLRVYLRTSTDEALALVDLAEAMSARLCESCGNRGRLRGDAWLKTLCDICANAQGYADQEPCGQPAETRT